ncbi:hypothetical protein JNUCC32_19765 [Paenibacillus sp. JNUCC32]|uniref:hypothetical protein n=1 Tax=Paenibacillus TaxID=44249 RepID=UPI00178897AB|nr:MULTISPECIES: hypothetical protein [Paenibacillus]QOT08395.1 hypothetical protein JNUCC32_19765 [Paenibacillus sp. JNUCC-32]GIP06425.1 hypothetical protein J28TS4_48320 [Paenibacillus lautus]
MRGIWKLNRPVWAGIAAGILLGLFLKIIEHITSLEVYTLLLNVDYVPLLNELKLSELVEFALHLVISVLLSIALAIFLKQKNWSRRRSLFWVSLACLAVGLLLYPTTVLSDRTPELSDPAALLFWLAGHLLYGIAMGWLLASSRGASA